MPTTHFTSTWFFKWNPPGDNTPSPPQVLHSLAPVSPHHAHGSFDAEPSSRRLGKAFNGSSRFGEFGFEDGDKHRAVTRHDLGILGMRMGITPPRHFVLSRETDDDDARATHDTPQEPRGVLSPKAGYAICGAYDCVRKESGVFRAYVFLRIFSVRFADLSKCRTKSSGQTDRQLVGKWNVQLKAYPPEHIVTRALGGRPARGRCAWTVRPWTRRRGSSCLLPRRGHPRPWADERRCVRHYFFLLYRLTDRLIATSRQTRSYPPTHPPAWWSYLPSPVQPRGTSPRLTQSVVFPFQTQYRTPSARPIYADSESSGEDLWDAPAGELIDLGRGTSSSAGRHHGSAQRGVSTHRSGGSGSTARRRGMARRHRGSDPGSTDSYDDVENDAERNSASTSQKRERLDPHAASRVVERIVERAASSSHKDPEKAYEVFRESLRKSAVKLKRNSVSKRNTATTPRVGDLLHESDDDDHQSDLRSPPRETFLFPLRERLVDRMGFREVEGGEGCKDLVAEETATEVAEEPPAIVVERTDDEQQAPQVATATHGVPPEHIASQNPRPLSVAANEAQTRAEESPAVSPRVRDMLAMFSQTEHGHTSLSGSQRRGVSNTPPSTSRGEVSPSVSVDADDLYGSPVSELSGRAVSRSVTTDNTPVSERRARGSRPSSIRGGHPRVFIIDTHRTAAPAFPSDLARDGFREHVAESAATDRGGGGSSVFVSTDPSGSGSAFASPRESYTTATNQDFLSQLTVVTAGRARRASRTSRSRALVHRIDTLETERRTLSATVERLDRELAAAATPTTTRGGGADERGDDRGSSLGGQVSVGRNDDVTPSALDLASPPVLAAPIAGPITPPTTTGLAGLTHQTEASGSEKPSEEPSTVGKPHGSKKPLAGGLYKTLSPLVGALCFILMAVAILLATADVVDVLHPNAPVAPDSTGLGGIKSLYGEHLVYAQPTSEVSAAEKTTASTGEYWQAQVGPFGRALRSALRLPNRIVVEWWRDTFGIGGGDPTDDPTPRPS